MANLLNGIKPTLLMGPGPSMVYDEVYAALAKPTLGHLDPYFFTIMDGVKDGLRVVMNTKNPVTFAVSGTGSAGMETVFTNLVEPGDRVLIIVNGFFSKRMEEVAGRLGAKIDLLDFEWGTPIVPDKVAEQLKKGPYAIVAMVHAETSTGMCNPVKEVGELVAKTGALLLVDCVTSLGAMPVDMDERKIDALYSCSQKGLSCPPGLAPVSFSPKAMEKILARKTRVPNWYLDVALLLKYWEGEKRAYHHPMSSNLIYALYEGLQMLLAEGLDKVFARQIAVQKLLGEDLAKMGISFLIPAELRLPHLNVVNVPAGVDDMAVRSRLLKEFRIEIGGGLGALAGKVWRIGLMGHTARPENVNRLLAALKACL
jgi:alanine-glyoxylate transaminase/serine-glyoxylate transaminase/serine-pyruvate transaminase